MKKLYSLKENWIEGRIWKSPSELMVIKGNVIFLEVLNDIRTHDLRRNREKKLIPPVEVYFWESIGEYYVAEGISTVRAFSAYMEGAEKVPLVVLGEISSSDLAGAFALASVNINNVRDLEKVLEERSE